MKTTKEFATGVMYLMPKLMEDFQLSDFQAAGIVGNLARESGLIPGRQEIRPNKVSGKGGLGLAQWTNERRTRFEKYAANRAPVTDMGVNYAFLCVEFKGSYSSVISRLRNAKTIEDATTIVERYYEIAGVIAMADRIFFAKQALSYWTAHAANQTTKQENKSMTTQTTMTMVPAKPWYQSTTILSAGISILLGFGAAVYPALAHVQPDAITQLVIDCGVVISGIGAIFGRTKATQPIGQSGTVAPVQASALAASVQDLNKVLTDLHPVLQSANATLADKAVTSIQGTIADAEPIIDMLITQNSMLSDISALLNRAFGHVGK